LKYKANSIILCPFEKCLSYFSWQKPYFWVKMGKVNFHELMKEETDGCSKEKNDPLT